MASTAVGTVEARATTERVLVAKVITKVDRPNIADRVPDVDLLGRPR